MLEVNRPRPIAIERNGRARKIQRPPLVIGHYFHGIRVLHVEFRRMGLQRADGGRRVLHNFQQRRDLFQSDQRLIALHVDIDIGGLAAGNFVYSLRAAAVRTRSHLRLPAMGAANLQDFLGIGRDDDLRQQRRRSHRLVDDSDQRFACNLAQHLARQTRGSQAGRNDGNRFHRWVERTWVGRSRLSLAAHLRRRETCRRVYLSSAPLFDLFRGRS